MKRHFLATALVASALHAQSVPTDDSDRAGDVVHLDNYIVSASPSARSQADLSQATTVLAGRALSIHERGTLGETLAQQPGVSSTYYGPGASRPVIRGIGGERVRILENGAGGFDAAGLSPDHATSVEPLFARRIEVVRGPAALMYGSAAAGGVVNVVDGRIPDEPPAGGTSGEISLRAASASEELSAAFRAAGGAGTVAWRAGVFDRDAGDLRTPSEGGGTIANSAVEARGGFLGAGVFRDRSSLGAAATLYETHYGVPSEEDVTIDLRQERLDVKAVVNPADGWFDTITVDVAAADYTHTEFEGEEPGTVFNQDSFEARLELPYSRDGGGSGALGAQFSRVNLRVAGDEAFLPPTVTENVAAFAHESRKLGEFLLEAGARVERLSIAPDVPSLVRRSETTASFSAGAVWLFDRSWSVAFSALRTARPPNATELFANGPHVATGSFEIGSTALTRETGDSIELTLRKRRGRVTAAATVFSNSIDGFIFRSPTGGEEDGLPVYEYAQSRARFRGFELESLVHLHDANSHGFDLRFAADAVRAVRRPDGEPLPAIPPMRFFGGVRYGSDVWSAGVDVVHAMSQDRVAPFETDTEGYTLLGADVGWSASALGFDWRFTIRGNNLLDRVARNHVSLLKDSVPLPGRDISFTVRAEF